MTARHTSRITTRVATLLATGSLAVAGIALGAAPAQAAGADGDCPPATQPPSANTWIDPHTGAYRGVRKISDVRGPGAGYIPMWSIRTYETFGHDYYQRETWDVDHLREPVRTDCRREERDPEPPKPTSGGGGGGRSSGGLGGGGTLWMSSLGGDDEERYGTVGEIQPL